MRVPLEIWILPVVGKINTLKDGPSAGLGIEEAEVASPFSPLPYTFHGGLEAPFSHLALPFAHGDILAVEGYVLNPFLTTPLCSGQLSAKRPSTNGGCPYLIQVLRHQAFPTRRLHYLEGEVSLFGKADLELEGAGFAAEIALGKGAWGEIEDLEGADAETKETVHGLFVVGGDDTDFCDGS